MIVLVPAKDWIGAIPQRKEEEAKRLASLAREYASLYGELIVETVRSYEQIDFGAVKAIEIETLFGLAIGRSRGASKLIYTSPSLGAVDKLLLLFKKKEATFLLRDELIGNRHINIKVYL